MKNYFIVLNTSNGAFLLLHESGALLAFDSEEKARSIFERSYKECHERDGTWSNSAAIHWLQLQPSVIAMPKYYTTKQLIYRLKNEEKPDLSCCNISGAAVSRMTVTKIDNEVWKEYKVGEVSLI